MAKWCELKKEDFDRAIKVGGSQEYNNRAIKQKAIRNLAFCGVTK